MTFRTTTLTATLALVLGAGTASAQKDATINVPLDGTTTVTVGQDEVTVTTEPAESDQTAQADAPAEAVPAEAETGMPVEAETVAPADAPVDAAADAPAADTVAEDAPAVEAPADAAVEAPAADATEAEVEAPATDTAEPADAAEAAEPADAAPEADAAEADTTADAVETDASDEPAAVEADMSADDPAATAEDDAVADSEAPAEDADAAAADDAVVEDAPAEEVVDEDAEAGTAEVEEEAVEDVAEEESVPEEPASHGGEITNVAFPFEGPFGKYDQFQLQRGLQVYTEVCSACHGLRYVPLRTLGNANGPGLPEDQVRAYAEQMDITDLETGEDRPRLPTDHFPTVLGEGMGPDLSLMAKARAGFHGPLGSGLNQFVHGMGGPEYIYSILTHYTGGDKEEAGTLLYENTTFAGGWIQMAPPLFEDGVEYADGTPATIEQMAEDVSAFLMWTAEPKLMERKHTGLVSVVFLILLSVLLYLTNKRLWWPVKHGRDH